MRFMAITALGLLALAALVAAACGGGSSDEQVIEVRLLNWAVEPAVASAPAGNITFRAIHEQEDHAHGSGNEGGEVHELAVSRKNVDGSGELIGTTGEIAVGKQKDLKLKLAAGAYELQCNLVEMIDGKPIAHYPEGMHTPFTVS